MKQKEKYDTERPERDCESGERALTYEEDCIISCAEVIAERTTRPSMPYIHTIMKQFELDRKALPQVIDRLKRLGVNLPHMGGQICLS